MAGEQSWLEIFKNIILKIKLIRKRRHKEHNLSIPRKLSAEQIYLFALFVCLNVFDYFITVVALNTGEATEHNPFAAPFLNFGNYFVPFIIKFGMTGVIIISMIRVFSTKKKEYNLGRAIMMFLITYYIILMFHNVLQLNFLINCN